MRMPIRRTRPCRCCGKLGDGFGRFPCGECRDAGCAFTGKWERGERCPLEVRLGRGKVPA